MKFIYKAIFLIVVFMASLLFFAGNMKENVYRVEKKVTNMREATLPVISMRVDENEINRIHGYCSNLDELLIRESITPLTQEQEFTVLITEGDYIIKKVNYEITDAESGQKLEEGSIIALDKEGDKKTARIKVKEAMSSGVEYVAKITLISNESKRIYYYTRFKMFEGGYLKEKLGFVKEFHQAALTKDTSAGIKKYLEYKAYTDNSSFAKVNIYSSEDMVTYGSLNPEVIYEELPCITEFSKDTASIVLSFSISVKTDSGTEYYNVKEAFRFRYTENRVYLYDYEREMETCFQPEMVSLSKSQFKIGITSDIKMDFFYNSGNNIVAFVRGKELWSYNAEDNSNSMVQVFSFKQKKTDYIRDTFEQHDVKIMNMDDEGNIDFMVYGYMNRGEYEGRVGIVIYRFYREEGRIEEQMYLPVNTTYEMLKEEIGQIAYRNRYDLVYFSVFDNFYSYNFVSKQLILLAEDCPKENMVFSENEQYAAWQNGREAGESITVLMLETGEKSTIVPGNNEYIRILGKSNDNFLYGLVKRSDMAADNLGKTLYPMHTLIISNRQGEILKEYHQDGYYVDSVKIIGNMIELNRFLNSDTAYSGYERTNKDNIMNREVSNTLPYGVTARIMDLTLTEYYITMPPNHIIESVPEVQTVQNTVITDDTTVRISKPDSYKMRYFAYSFGRIILSTDLPGKAVLAADAAVGTVTDGNGKIVWQRGIKGNRAEITGMLPVSLTGGMDSLQAVLKMLFSYKSVDIDTVGLRREEKSIMAWMEGYLNVQALDLSGATLDEVLYMVYKGHPVIGMKEDNVAVLITGYDAMGITVMNPLLGRTERYSLKDAENMFDAIGNLFISYLD